jgi:hypothetical protein
MQWRGYAEDDDRLPSSASPGLCVSCSAQQLPYGLRSVSRWPHCPTGPRELFGIGGRTQRLPNGAPRFGALRARDKDHRPVHEGDSRRCVAAASAICQWRPGSAMKPRLDSQRRHAFQRSHRTYGGGGHSPPRAASPSHDGGPRWSVGLGPIGCGSRNTRTNGAVRPLRHVRRDCERPLRLCARRAFRRHSVFGRRGTGRPALGPDVGGCRLAPPFDGEGPANPAGGRTWCVGDAAIPQTVGQQTRFVPPRGPIDRSSCH